MESLPEHSVQTLLSDLYGNAVESFGHEDIHQVFGQVVFDAKNHVDVVWRNLPLYMQTPHIRTLNQSCFFQFDIDS